MIKSQVCGLEINFTPEGEEYYYIVLKKNSKSLDVVLKGKSKNLSEFPPALIKNKIPIALIINGKGIIIKKIPSVDLTNPEEFIARNIPSINLNEFAVQLYIQGNNTFAALCRRETIEKEIEKIGKTGFEIASILIGAPSVTGIQPLYSNINSLVTSNHRAEIQDGSISEFIQAEDETYNLDVDGITLSQSNVLGFSGGFCYFMQKKLPAYENSFLTNVREKHIEKNKFRFLMICSVGLIFILAALNAVVYFSYYDKNNKIESELSVYQGKYEQVNKLLDEYGKKKALIENAGILSDNRLSEYADKLASTIPGEIMLSELTFNPKQDNEDTEDSLVKFKSKTILIRGNCNKSLVVNDWVNVLKMQDFVKGVNLEKFSYNKEGLIPNYELSILFE